LKEIFHGCHKMAFLAVFGLRFVYSGTRGISARVTMETAKFATCWVASTGQFCTILNPDKCSFEKKRHQRLKRHKRNHQFPSTGTFCSSSRSAKMFVGE
jgi:hypothetical protein